MAKVYRRSDRVRFKIHDVTVGVAPLSQHEKQLILTTMTEAQAKKDMLGLANATRLSIKYGLKEIDGVEYLDGEKFVLKFEDDGGIPDDLLDELYNMEHTPQLMQTCMQLYSNYFDRNFSKIKGVEVIDGKKQDATAN